MQSRKIQAIASQHLSAIQDTSVMRPREEQLVAYYNAHLDKYTSAGLVTVREIGKKVTIAQAPDKRNADIENAKKSLTEIRKRILGGAKFEDIARTESEAIGTRSRGGLAGTKSENDWGPDWGPAFKNQIDQLKPGDISEPFLHGPYVLIVKLEERLPSAVKPFEEVRKQVIRDYFQEMPAKSSDQLQDRILKESAFELKF
jgi:peptidyl-prolyl cis-trans isomerase C